METWDEEDMETGAMVGMRMWRPGMRRTWRPGLWWARGLGTWQAACHGDRRRVLSVSPSHPLQLNYLGPPFNEPDFNPPRLARAERVPSATVDLDLWRGLTDNARLAANYRAYSRLLCYLRALDGQAGTAELRHRLGHFCSSLQGLVLSIAGVMSSLGYPLPAGPAGPPAGPPGAPVAPNDFLKKMDDFWLLKELQTWLWRSAKDFNRLKKKVPPAVVTLRLEARGF
ncbi:cardiotrophin-like cytokine factor 1 [Limosa lapponica baueri]|uniref:Cardiotrophin-like cytokine factor 1 n=1 Tax=Limosa lapponica baueri TaxID=1758121 RepID=A0A2I0T1Y6_LIMLA|nr:cardiotrophin-like cytokine factor 1 [Limosa lapponica baueri]